jgi:hypothetical protein
MLVSPIVGRRILAIEEAEISLQGRFSAGRHAAAVSRCGQRALDSPQYVLKREITTSMVEVVGADQWAQLRRRIR